VVWRGVLLRLNEHERFVSTCTRRIPGLPGMGWIEGKRILVTGGTGCIGSRLLRELATHNPAKLASVSRIPGLSPWPHTGGVDYREADIRDYGALLAAFDGTWDVVFHTAAQRDPGLAERLVLSTVTTNVLGSANVLAACEAKGVPRVVFASTGKALRPYSPDVYTASKRAAEWLLASSPVPARSAVRFTHVVDNSVFYHRLRDWCRYGQPVRLHGRDIVFYTQSAREAAELLMGAALASEGQPQVHAITDLGMPVALHDLAVQVRDDMCSDSEITVSGYEPGYEAAPFPGLYDPLTAGDVSPLLNAFEAADAWQPYPGVDAFPLRFAPGDISLRGLRRACAPPCGKPCPPDIRTELAGAGWDIMEAAVATAQPAAVERVAALCRPHEPLRSPHDKMLRVIRSALKADGAGDALSPAGCTPPGSASQRTT
jgi:nucleoside-diphosphate-sugar epimerase